ncbi:MAG: Gfo/Idh/MocA family protein [Gaiellaceae bacterium]
MRAALVGTGFIARVHAIALRAVGVEVAAVCGRTREGAEAFGAGRPYDDLSELLATERLDALHVCTPNDVHADQALAALACGLPVVCEKPLATSTLASGAMVEAASDHRLVNATCYHVRGYPLVEQMRVDVASGAVGEVSFVHGRYLCDDVLFPTSGWRGDPLRSGPSYVVGDLATHWLDLAEHVTTQRLAGVLSEFRSFAAGPLEDYAALLLRFDGGASGSLVVSAGAAGRKNQLLFELEGTTAGLTWDQERPTELLFRPAAEPKRVVVKDPTANAKSAGRLARYPAGHGEGYGAAFRNLFESVYAAIDGRPHDPFPTFEDGHRGVAALEAAVASARDGTWAQVAA